MPRIKAHPVLADKQAKEVGFMFNGESVRGLEGEALSSALVALGVTQFSFHRKDFAPQGLFCANGQCSQCTVLVGGIPRKACVTPLAEGMDVRTLVGLPRLPADDMPLRQAEKQVLRTDILVVGGGPSGLSAAYELGKMGYQVIVADDKEDLGGKLVLQTHKFFGSEQDCYAGVRGVDIADLLATKLSRLPNVQILKNAPVVALFKDRKAGVYKDYSSYVLIEFTALVVAAGAREKGVLFPGNDLPGVFGAGAFQTLVNRDRVEAAKRIFIVGSGNVGLIAAYHALQAGIEVAGIVEIMGKINGYKVHADKIRRMGIPIHLNTTVLGASGDGKVEHVTTAEVDDRFRPIPQTCLTYDVDAVLIATGLSPCDEFLRQARTYGIIAVAAGDADEIAEASSAMFGGKIAAYQLATLLGKKVEMKESWLQTRGVLKSKPGECFSRSPVIPGPEWRPVFFCSEQIPCNPCSTVCPNASIHLRPLRGDIMDLPYFDGEKCSGCMACVSSCPGLAISLVRSLGATEAEVVLPWEFGADFPDGQEMDLVGQDGIFIERAPVIGRRYSRKNKTWLLSFRVSLAKAACVAGIRVQAEALSRGKPVGLPGADELDAIVCRCERVTLGEIVKFIKENNVRDINQLKSLRVGMGACGGKTCSQLLPRAFRLAGVDMADVEPTSVRPLFMEVPMGEIVNESLGRIGSADASQRGAP